ncbi:hypothetical protein MKX01_030496, partial [Papaver californicum]
VEKHVQIRQDAALRCMTLMLDRACKMLSDVDGKGGVAEPKDLNELAAPNPSVPNSDDQIKFYSVNPTKAVNVT